jgi:hypothetical protein
MVPTFALAATPPAPDSSPADSTPAEGVPLEVRRGFFTETDLGLFSTVGGADGYSNAESYLQLGVGYDFRSGLELGAAFGLGSSGANCLSARDALGVCDTPDSFTASFLDLSVGYLHRLQGRLFLVPRLAAGYTRIDPSPRVNASGEPTRASGLNLGAGVGVEYATAMDHFSIGADLMFRYVLGVRVATLALYPRVKYTF